LKFLADAKTTFLHRSPLSFFFFLSPFLIVLSSQIFLLPHSPSLQRAPTTRYRPFLYPPPLCLGLASLHILLSLDYRFSNDPLSLRLTTKPLAKPLPPRSAYFPLCSPFSITRSDVSIQNHKTPLSPSGPFLVIVSKILFNLSSFYQIFLTPPPCLSVLVFFFCVRNILLPTALFPPLRLLPSLNPISVP